MQSSLASFSRFLAPHWLSIAAGAFLLSMLYLIGNLHSSQVELRQNADARLVSIGEARAAQIGEFLIERRQAAARLAGSEDIANYFSNLDLGMSVRYGLFANLAAIERRFQATMDEEKYHGNPAYLRLAFFDRNGTAQVNVGASSVPTPSPTADLAEPGVQIDEKRRLIVASAPVLQKGKMRGVVETVSSLNLLASLVSTNDLGQRHEFLLGDDGEVLIPVEWEHSPIVAHGRALAAIQPGHIQALSNLEASELKGYLALRSPIRGTRLSLLRLASVDELYGHTLSSVFVFYIGLFAILLFAVAIGFERMRQNAARLQVKIAESNRHRTELAEHNLALSQEIKHREAVEKDLQRQSEALDKTNAELIAREVELKQLNRRIDIALNNMTHGLCMFDAEHNLIVCNQTYVQMYSLTPELSQPGVSLPAIDGYRVKIGNGALANPEQVAAESAIATREASAFIQELMDGRIVAVSQRPMQDGGWVAVHEDITERRRAEAKIAHLARHDMLTNLPNRVLFREQLETEFGRIQTGRGFAVHCLDLDHFKDVNDTLGHPVGDELLKLVAARLTEVVPSSDFIARIGGDEFAMVQTDVVKPEQCSLLASRIVDRISEPYDIDGRHIVIGTSIGIAIAPGDGTNPDILLKNADMALYLAKGEGRGTHRFFEREMDKRLQARRVLELDLRKAIANGEFELYYQPIIDLQTGKVSCFEALLRWNHPERGMISPLDFIPLAEETGLILPLGEWVLRTACQQAVKWPKPIGVAVNLSATQFKGRNIIQITVNALATSGLAADRLDLEITESVLLQDEANTLAILHQLREIGVQISMDDFGTGYSSLAYLRNFPFDRIKIDRSFVREMLVRKDCRAIVQAVVSLARSLGITTVIEGIETKEQLECAQADGCDLGQGYIFSKPMPELETAAFLAKNDRQAAAA